MRDCRRYLRRRASGLLVLLVALLSLLTPSTSLAQNPAEQISRETIEPGIEHITITRVRQREDATDRWLINVLEINPRRARLESALALDEIVGTETTSSIAARHGAIAAINGGYFRTTGIIRGEPAGTFVIGDKLLSEPVSNRASLVLGFDGGGARAALTHIDSSSEVRTSAASRRIDGVNRPREKDEIIVYTPEFHRTTLTGPDGIEVVVVAGRAASIARAGSRLIPANGFVLSATGEARGWLERNIRLRGRVTISMAMRTSPAIPFRIMSAVGGGPQLVSDGRPTAGPEFDSFSQSLIQMRHPRTAFGVRTDGTLLFVTVDGRQPAVSVGMTIAELASLMVDLECREAINLDGGGSTTMVIRDKVVNHPSDQTGERPVSDAILIFARR